MNSIRKIRRIEKGKPTIEGAGVHLKRAFGNSAAPQFDPFLMLDDFHSDNPADYLAGFPWHPHRGIETITYVLEGLIEHGDSMGNKGVIGAGDVQWMTAGSGIIHQEMPKQSPRGGLWGLQFWANLPASRKMMAPRYRDVKAADIPEVRLEGGVRAKVVAGKVGDAEGPVKDIVIDPEMLDISIPAGTVFRLPIAAGRTVFAYIIDGEGCFEERRGVCGAETVVLFDQEGDVVQARTTEKPVRFLLLSGKPIGEPIAWRGPIVMNTQEELRTAFEELERGVFVK